MSKLKIKGVSIVCTFAEAFPMVGTRIIITAPTLEWAVIAGRGHARNLVANTAHDAEGTIKDNLAASLILAVGLGPFRGPAEPWARSAPVKMRQIG